MREPTPPPVNSDQYRYNPPPQYTGAQHAPPPKKTSAARWVTVAAGAAAVLGSFLPWITVTAPFVGTMSVTGTDSRGGDGWITVGIGLALVFLGILLLRGHQFRVAVTIVSVALFGVAAYEVLNLANKMADAQQESDMVVATIGNGLWLVLGAGITAAIGMILAWARM